MNKKSIKISVIIILISVLFSCAIPTPYQPNALIGGYSETQIDSDKFIVNFKGNGFTSYERVQDMLLLRSSELAINNGYGSFEIFNEKTINSPSSFSTPTTTTGTYNTSVYRNNASTTGTSFITPGQTHQVNKYTNSISIKFTNEKSESSFDAEFLSKSIKSKYDL